MTRGRARRQTGGQRSQLSSSRTPQRPQTTACPTREAAERRYDIQVDDEETLHTLQRLGASQPHRVEGWIAEGMTTETMGDPQAVAAFRRRQQDRPPEVPTDIERRNKHALQRSTEAASESARAGETEVPAVVRDVVASSGRGLDGDIRSVMADRMGESLDDVRVHTGPQAAAACEAIDARAFTVGNHVAFGAGEYDPASPEGQHVIAHELAHVRQQTGGAVSMLPRADAGLEIDPDPALEREAERTAQRVMCDGDLSIQRMGKTDVHVQRSRVGDAIVGARETIGDVTYDAMPESVTDRYDQRQDELTPNIDGLGEEAAVADLLETMLEDIRTLFAEVRDDNPLVKMGEAGTGETLKVSLSTLGAASKVPLAEEAGAITGAIAESVIESHEEVLELLDIEWWDSEDSAAQIERSRQD